MMPEKPGIYRFRVSYDSQVEVYIGETNNLSRRMNFYRSRTGRTVTRVRTELLLRHLAAARYVECSIVTAAMLAVDGESLPADLTRKSVRLFVENAALAAAGLAGEYIHNL